MKKFPSGSNIFASYGRQVRVICLPYVQHLCRFPASQEDKYRDEIKYILNAYFCQPYTYYIE